MDQADSVADRPIGLLIAHGGVVVGGVGVLVLAALFTMYPAAFSVMMFDSPGSDDVVWTQLAALGMLFLPISCLVAAGLGCVPLVTSGVGFARGRSAWVVLSMVASMVCFALPLLDVAVIVAGFYGLETYCDGAFAC